MDREINIWLNHNPYKDIKRAKPHSDAILQQLLQNALNTSSYVEIKKNQNGKPYIDQNVYFSHSNCRQLYAYVISNEHEVGIDVEYINLKRPMLKLAARYFHPSEHQELSKLPVTKQIEQFYKQWTHKEAWCKLEGGNLWSYLGKKTNEVKNLRLYDTDLVKDFVVTLASPLDINKIRINSIGNQ